MLNYDDGPRDVVTFTDEEMSVMMNDPAFGYVRRCGHPTTIVNGVLMDDDCLTCEFAHEGE